MKKYLYVVIQIDENGKKYAFARKLPADINLLDLPHIPRAEIVRAAPTWKMPAKRLRAGMPYTKRTAYTCTTIPHFNTKQSPGNGAFLLSILARPPQGLKIAA